MRTTAEIAFRLRQELANVALLLRPPRLSAALLDSIRTPLSGLPAPALLTEPLRGSDFGAELLSLAGRIASHRIPLLGLEFAADPPIAWRRDFVSGRETPAVYFRRIPYLNPSIAGDHKVIWELSRHQHLVAVAQALYIEDRPEFLAAIERHLASWNQQNPFQRGINWASALEVAFRALSWIWLFHLAGDRLTTTTARRQLLTGLYRHGVYLEYNLSVYFSPNTHLLGEAVALHALGRLFPEFPSSARWRSMGARIVSEEALRQVRPDGSHFEQSTYYQVYALDMFLFSAVLGGGDDSLRGTLGRMAEYLDALLDPCNRLPFLGDDDGGRFFHPYGGHDRYALGTLAAAGAFLHRPEWIRAQADLWPMAAWWLGPGVFSGDPPALRERSSRLFADAGVAIMRAGTAAALMDAGPFGPGSGGHSHSDTLSLVVASGCERILADPATYTYAGDPRARDRFRGSAAHNTVRINGLDQADPAGLFRWRGKPEVRVLQWRSDEREDWLDAACIYRGFTHRRRILFIKPALWLIVDEISGPAGSHVIEQFWHPGAVTGQETAATFRIGAKARLTLSGPAILETGGEVGWLSDALGRKQPAPVIRLLRQTSLPVTLPAAIDLDPPNAIPALAWESQAETIHYGNLSFAVRK